MTIISKLQYALNSTYLEISKELKYHELPPITVVDEAKYKSMLIGNQYIHNHLELKINNTLLLSSPTALTDFFHSRLEWLSKDFKSLGMSPNVTSSNDFSKEKFETLCCMLGAWYVLEGSMLGNRMIYNWLRKSPHLSHIPEFYFFKNYDKQVGKRWRQLHALIIEHVKDEEKCINEVANTFRFYAQVLYENNTQVRFIKVA